MCLGGGGSPKVEVPKPPPLPPPLPAPPPPKPVDVAPKRLATPDAKPDIRIGKAKSSSTSRRDRSTTRGASGSQSLSIGSNQGMTL